MATLQRLALPSPDIEVGPMQLLRSFPVLDAVGIEGREIQQTQAHFGIAKNSCPLGSSSGFPPRISRSLLWRRHHSTNRAQTSRSDARGTVEAEQAAIHRALFLEPHQ